MLRPLLIALLALAIAPTAASAAVLDIAVTPKSGADFGESHTITGKLTGPYGAPLAGRPVELEVRSYPYRGGFQKVATATTGLDGRFSFEREVRPQPPGPRPGARVRRSQRRSSRSTSSRAPR